MATPTLKQQKTFAAIRIAGGISAAVVLGYSFIANILAGAPAEGSVLLTGAMAFVGLGYAAYYTRTLSQVAKADQGQA